MHAHELDRYEIRRRERKGEVVIAIMIRYYQHSTIHCFSVVL